jgi:hypothetical protein
MSSRSIEHPSAVGDDGDAVGSVGVLERGRRVAGDRQAGSGDAGCVPDGEVLRHPYRALGQHLDFPR